MSNGRPSQVSADEYTPSAVYDGVRRLQGTVFGGVAGVGRAVLGVDGTSPLDGYREACRQMMAVYGFLLLTACELDIPEFACYATGEEVAKRQNRYAHAFPGRVGKRLGQHTDKFYDAEVTARRIAPRLGKLSGRSCTAQVGVHVERAVPANLIRERHAVMDGLTRNKTWGWGVGVFMGLAVPCDEELDVSLASNREVIYRRFGTFTQQFRDEPPETPSSLSLDRVAVVMVGPQFRRLAPVSGGAPETAAPVSLGE